MRVWSQGSYKNDLTNFKESIVINSCVEMSFTAAIKGQSCAWLTYETAYRSMNIRDG